MDTVVEVMEGLNEVPGPRDDVKFIPVMHNGPAVPVYVESIDSEDSEAPVVEWVVRESSELVWADSFEVFLEQFADRLESNAFVFHDAQLRPLEDLEEIDEDFYFEDDDYDEDAPRA